MFQIFVDVSVVRHNTVFQKYAKWRQFLSISVACNETWWRTNELSLKSKRRPINNTLFGYVS